MIYRLAAAEDDDDDDEDEDDDEDKDEDEEDACAWDWDWNWNWGWPGILLCRLDDVAHWFWLWQTGSQIIVPFKQHFRKKLFWWITQIRKGYANYKIS